MMNEIKKDMISVKKYRVKKTDKIIDEAYELKIYQSGRQYIVTFTGYTIYIAEEYKEAFNHFMMLLKTLTILTLPKEAHHTLELFDFPDFSMKITENNEIMIMLEMEKRY